MVSRHLAAGDNGGMRILVVEDDPGIATGLEVNLRQRGHAVDICASVASAWNALCAEPFEALVLDMGLPDGDGGELLRRLRAGGAGDVPDPATPVLIMTARDAISQRIAGLDLGADDYLAKPFDFDELEARLRAITRRAVGRASPTISVRDIAVNPATRTVQRGETPVELTAREFSLLLVLLEAGGRVLSRQQIEALLYAWNESVGSNAVEVHVHHLRRKLGDDLILNMRGVGYFIPRDGVHKATG